jgi:excisionase family DNA binding protein
MATEGPGAPLLLTVPEAAELMRCSTRQVQYLIARDGLPVVYLGVRQRRIPRAALERWITTRAEAVS